MKVKEIVRIARNRITDVNEIEYEDGELLDYLNDAIDYLSMQLITLHDSDLIKDITVIDGTAVPSDFIDKFAGNFPVFVSDGVFKILDGSTSVQVRYYAPKPHVLFLEDQVPFKDIYKSVLTQLTAIYALNRNEYDISQDKGLLNDLLAAHAAAKK